MSDQSHRPQAREVGLLIGRLGDELLIFDGDRNRAHSLNDSAARVWRVCAGPGAPRNRTSTLCCSPSVCTSASVCAAHYAAGGV
ncbi:MAG TPA: hypothetical protein VII87_06080 [Solirubrobacteraceae bacterium]|jgi:hypothetical protein